MFKRQESSELLIYVSSKAAGTLVNASVGSCRTN